MTYLSDILNLEDGTFGPGMDAAHQRAYSRIRANAQPDSTEPKTKIPVRAGTEVEFHRDGGLKRYKY